MSSRRLRILLAKPGLDGHDRGLHVLARGLREAGHEVILTGLFQSPQAIARAAVDEDADVVGLSILAGGHLGLTADVIAAMREQGLECPIVVGGTIPDRDVERLLEMGCAAVFPVGSKLSEIAAWMDELAAEALL